MKPWGTFINDLQTTYGNLSNQVVTKRELAAKMISEFCDKLAGVYDVAETFHLWGRSFSLQVYLPITGPDAETMVYGLSFNVNKVITLILLPVEYDSYDEPFIKPYPEDAFIAIRDLNMRPISNDDLHTFLFAASSHNIALEYLNPTEACDAIQKQLEKSLQQMLESQAHDMITGQNDRFNNFISCFPD